MAVDSRGPKWQPVFDGTKAGNTAADQNAIGEYAALVGNRIVDTNGHRTAFASYFGFQPWHRLEYAESDTGDEYIYDIVAGAWTPRLLNGSFQPAGSVNMNPASDLSTKLRLSNNLVSFVLNVDPGANALSAGSSNKLIGVIPGVFQPPTKVYKVAAVRPAGSSSFTGATAHVVIGVDGLVSIAWTSGPIASGALLALEASWPADF